MDFAVLTESAMRDWLLEVARLKIQVFREWPYLYDLDMDYDSRYLSHYAMAPDSVLVLVMDGDEVVGASTGMPLIHEKSHFKKQFQENGMMVQDWYYFAESVLLPRYRGKGLGNHLFDLRKEFAEKRDFQKFCFLDNEKDEPRKPLDARDLKGFWRQKGFCPTDLFLQISCKENGESASVQKSLRLYVNEASLGSATFPLK